MVEFQDMNDKEFPEFRQTVSRDKPNLSIDYLVSTPWHTWRLNFRGKTDKHPPHLHAHMFLATFSLPGAFLLLFQLCTASFI